MRVCIVFRGENERNVKDRPVVSSLKEKVENWNRALFEPLKEKNIEFNVIFFTYPSDILKELQSLVDPLLCITSEKISQHKNMVDLSYFLETESEDYDRFIICRFDIGYRTCIDEWNVWDKKGVFVMNRDVNWNKLSYTNDVLFIVDKESIRDFLFVTKENLYSEVCLHEVGANFLKRSKNLHFILEGFYHIWNHPIVVVDGIEKISTNTIYRLSKEEIEKYT